MFYVVFQNVSIVPLKTGNAFKSFHGAFVYFKSIQNFCVSRKQAVCKLAKVYVFLEQEWCAVVQDAWLSLGSRRFSLMVITVIL